YYGCGIFFICVILRCPQLRTLSPYTTLFRSRQGGLQQVGDPRGARVGRGGLAGTLQLHAGGEELLDGQVVQVAGDALTLLQEGRSEEHTSELQSRENLVCRLLLEKKNIKVSS